MAFLFGFATLSSLWLATKTEKQANKKKLAYGHLICFSDLTDTKDELPCACTVSQNKSVQNVSYENKFD